MTDIVLVKIFYSHNELFGNRLELFLRRDGALGEAGVGAVLHEQEGEPVAISEVKSFVRAKGRMIQLLYADKVPFKF